jgi:hypothetical protein
MVIDKKFLNVQNVASNKEFLVQIDIFFMKQEHVRWKEPKFSDVDISYQIHSKFRLRVVSLPIILRIDVLCMWQLSNLTTETCQNWQLTPVKTDSGHLSKLRVDTCQNLAVLFLTVFRKILQRIFFKPKTDGPRGGKMAS